MTPYSFCIGRPTPHRAVVPCAIAHGFRLAYAPAHIPLSGADTLQCHIKFSSVKNPPCDAAVTAHVDDVVGSCARSMYAISVLRSHGIEMSALQQVFRVVVVSKLTYAASAWWGFTTSADRQRIDTVLSLSLIHI